MASKFYQRAKNSKRRAKAAPRHRVLFSSSQSETGFSRGFQAKPHKTVLRIRERAAPDFSLEWPSGRGHEVGVVQGKPDDIWHAISNGSKVLRIPLDLYEVEEDGAEAVVIIGPLESPISFVFDAAESSTLSAIIVDSKAPLQKIKQFLSRLFSGQLKVVFA